MNFTEHKYSCRRTTAGNIENRSWHECYMYKNSGNEMHVPKKVDSEEPPIGKCGTVDESADFATERASFIFLFNYKAYLNKKNNKITMNFENLSSQNTTLCASTASRFVDCFYCTLYSVYSECTYICTLRLFTKHLPISIRCYCSQRTSRWCWQFCTLKID